MSRYNAMDMLRLYKLVWGPGIHFGLYHTGTETIEAAAANTNVAIAERAGICSKDNILEVGSGEGDTARWLARTKQCRVTASNFTEAQIESGRALTEQAGLSDKVHHAWADYTKLPFKDAQFTVHLSQEAFVHCQNKPLYYSEAYRSLLPGGRLVFSEQTTNRKLCDAYTQKRLSDRHDNGDLWSADDMANAALEAGFTDVQIVDWSPHMAIHFANLADRIEANRDSLLESIPEVLLNDNENIWRWGAKIATEGKIGWCLLTARKPE